MKRNKIILAVVLLLILLIVFVLYRINYILRSNQNTGPDETMMFQQYAERTRDILPNIGNSYTLSPVSGERILLENFKGDTVVDGKRVEVELIIQDLNSMSEGYLSGGRLILTYQDTTKDQYLVVYKYANSEVEQLAYHEINSDFEGMIYAREKPNGIQVTLISDEPFDGPHTEKKYSTGMKYEQVYLLEESDLFLKN